MADYSALKQTIDNNVNTNGQQAITGAILNDVLNEMVDVLGEGYTFLGVATPTTSPTTPEGKAYYLAGAAGTYSNFGNIVVASDEVALLVWDGTAWAKVVTGAASADQVGNKTNVLTITQGAGHSSNADRVNVTIKQGDKFFVSAELISGAMTRLFVFPNYSDGTTGGNIGVVVPNQGYVEFTAAKDIVSLGYYWGGADVTQSGQVSINVLYALAAKAHLSGYDTKVVVMDCAGTYFRNIVLDTTAKSVTIKAVGIRLRAMGKTFTLSGTEDFVMSYNSAVAPNGAWMLSKDAIKNVANNGVIELSATNIFYAAVNNSAYLNNIILFPTFYNYVCYDGIFGNILLQRMTEFLDEQQTSKETQLLALLSANSLSPLVVSDDTNTSFNNIVLDATAQKVTIKAAGLRLRCYGKTIMLKGTEDFVMSYASATAPNGAWMLSLSALQNASDNAEITMSSDVLFYASVASAEYRNDIVLFSTYYGKFVPMGLFGEILLQRQIDAGASIAQAMQNYAFNSVYNEVDITAKAKEYSALINNAGKTEQFIFMTDPHLLGGSNVFDEGNFKTYIGLLQKYYNMLPVDWMICGGDWLNNGDYQESACWKLGYMDASMRKLFKHYYPLIGNHDYNYQGVVSADDSSRGDLTHQTLNNLMFRENGNTYYKFKGNNTQFYVFDTGIDWSAAMDAFKWEQIDWFAKALVEDDAEHSIILQHIYYTYETTINPMAANIQSVAGAYNAHTTITLNGITYDFTGCTGKIACAIAGHSHIDAIVTEGVSVPVWLTTNMTDGNTPTFDLLLVDYGANILKSVRVGTGSNRTMNLA